MVSRLGPLLAVALGGAAEGAREVDARNELDPERLLEREEERRVLGAHTDLQDGGRAPALGILLAEAGERRVEALREVAGLDRISTTVPVTFTLLFTEAPE